MNNYFERFIALFGSERFNRLANALVVIVGLGGVGGAALEVLVRSGVGKVVIVDFDKVEATNINRQIIATTTELGEFKTLAFEKRLKLINPNLQVTIYTEKLSSLNIDKILKGADFVIDAIDDLDNKVNIISYCQLNNIPFISAMGMALKIDPLSVKIMKMNQTTYDPLAKALRFKLKQKKINLAFTVVSSTEKPQRAINNVLGSYMAVTFTGGLLAADYTIKYLLGE